MKYRWSWVDLLWAF